MSKQSIDFRFTVPHIYTCMQQFYTNYSMVTDLFGSKLIFKVKILITVHVQVTLFEYLEFIVTYSCAFVCPLPPPPPAPMAGDKNQG